MWIFIHRPCYKYKNPQFLFFDEATNALDANNEKAIMENLQEFFKGRTVLVVAHRLSTVKNADKIVVLENGEIIEEGNHESLSKKKGKYYELVKISWSWVTSSPHKHSPLQLPQGGELPKRGKKPKIETSE